MRNLIEFILLFIPRYTTDEVALKDTGDGYDIICSMADLAPDEKFDAVATLNIFTWFGRAWPVVGEKIDVRPWPTN